MATPTPQETREIYFSAVETELPDTNPRQQSTFLNANGKGIALAVDGLHIEIENTKDQIFVRTATGDFLDLHGGEYFLTRVQATQSNGMVTATGTIGSVVPAGAILQSSTGATYTVDSEVTFAAISEVLDITSETFGVEANVTESATLTFESPLAGVNSSVTVNPGGLTGGIERQSDQDFRQRIVIRKSLPPQGGSTNDYKVFAKEAKPELTRVFIDQFFGPGTVRILFMMDDTYSDGLPLTPDIADVFDYIDDDSRRPITARIFVEAPVLQSVDFEIRLSPNTAAVQKAVESEIKNVIRTTGAPGQPLLRSKLNEAVSIAAGEDDHLITSPVLNVFMPVSTIPAAGTFTFLDL